jgi:hypothetical protein
MMEAFDIQIERWVRKALGLSQQAMLAIAQDALARVRELTPVITGNLRANWQVVPAGQENELERGPGTPAGRLDGGLALTQYAADGGAIGFKMGDRLLIMNPAVYARRVEFGFVGQDSRGRFYNQPGRGMMQQTITEMPQIAQRAVQRITRGVA